MTAITLDAPVRGRRAGRSARAAGVPVRQHPAAAATAPVRTHGRRGASHAARPLPLRLTRRGRLVITALLVAVGVVASLFAGGVSLAGTQAQHPPVRYVTVEPGETLWAIAGEVAPSVDRRDTVARILDLNAMSSSAVSAGQRIAVPAH